MSQQQDLFTDKPRGEQLALLRRVEITAFTLPSGKRVSPTTLKSVLRTIDDFEGQGRDCYASQASIASAVGCSRRTLRQLDDYRESMPPVSHTRHGA